ncbi:MAG: hypothetical protein IKH75_06820 [Ruminococcus sp.]|nr:hypothetical protein [Ruminococcus sp.]
MFRKVQLKFFAIITGTLIAIFIAVLGSINLIMDHIMERTSKVALKQIAAGIEYDENLNDFTYMPPDGEIRKRPENHTSPPEPPTETDAAVTDPPTEEDTETQATAAETAAPSTSEQTEAPTVQEETAAPVEEVPEEPVVQEPETPQEETPDQPAPEPETPQPENPAPQEPVQPEPTAPETGGGEVPGNEPSEGGNEGDQGEHHHGDNGQYQIPPYPMGPVDPYWWWWWMNSQGSKDNSWGAGWGNGGGYDWGNQHGAIMRTANTEMAPVLDGFTIVTLSEKKDTAEAVPEATKPRPADSRIIREPVPKSLDSIEFFIIMSDKDGKFVAKRNNDDLENEVAQVYITEILKKNEPSGTLNNYQFCSEPKSNGTLMVFTDKSAEIDMLNKLMRTTIMIGILSIIALSAASYFLSGLIVKPIQEAFNKQKQFISDASHELKTPLTVISANADVLSGEIGENKWLNYIQDQTDRMNVLVNELLNLTRLENNTSNFIMADFDLSQAITNTALPFECQAFESNKTFELNIVEGLHIVGSEQHIKQMAAIFIDNALKYSNEGGIVRVTLAKQGDKKMLYVYNSGKGIKESEKEKVFERFYRSDESRNRSTGGYGLGLAIAKSIIDRHKFKVHIENNEGRGICFVVTMG